MKRIYFLIVAFLILFGKANAQFTPGFMDLVKTPKTSYEGPMMDLILKSGQALTEELIGSNWRNHEKIYGIQDANGNQTLFGNDYWDTIANKWVIENRMAQTITYNASNKPITNYLTIVGSTGKILSRTQTFTYDGSGKYQPIRSLDSAWTPALVIFNSVDSMVYNGNGQIEQRVSARTFAGVYIISSRFKYTYNGAGNLTEFLEQDYAGSNTWEDNIRYTYTYNGSGKILTVLEESYSGTNWSNSDLDSFFYDGSGRMTAIKNYSPNGTAWIGDDWEIYTYTGNNITEVVNVNWISGTGWVNEKKLVFTYNGSVLSSGLEYLWSGSAWATTATTRINWTGGSTGIDKLDNTRFTIYPNPATHMLTIEGVSGDHVAVVSDLQGKEWIRAEVNSLQNNVDLNNLEQGVYLISLQDGNKVYTTRFIKQ